MLRQLTTVSIALLLATVAEARVERKPVQMENWAAERIGLLTHGCETGKSEYDRAYSSVVREMAHHASKFTEKSLDKLEKSALNDRSSFLDLLRIVTPYLLPRGYDGRLLFVECGLKLRQLHDERNAESIEDYKVCMDAQYPDQWPPLARQLFDCEKKFASK